MKLYKTVSTDSLNSIRELGLLTQNELHTRGMVGDPHVQYPLLLPALSFRFNYHFFRSDIPKLGHDITLLSYETDLSDASVANIRLTNSSSSLKPHYMNSVMPAKEFLQRSEGTLDWSTLDPITGYKKSKLEQMRGELEWQVLDSTQKWFVQLELDSMYDQYFPEFLISGPKILWDKLTVEADPVQTSIDDSLVLPPIREAGIWPGK